MPPALNHWNFFFFKINIQYLGTQMNEFYSEKIEFLMIKIREFYL